LKLSDLLVILLNVSMCIIPVDVPMLYISMTVLLLKVLKLSCVTLLCSAALFKQRKCWWDILKIIPMPLRSCCIKVS